MKFKKFWVQNHLNFAGIFLAGFALCCSFSISLTQLFLGLSLLIFLIDLFLYIKLNKSLKLKKGKKIEIDKKEKSLIEHFQQYKNHEIFYYLLAWIILRIIHVFLSPEPLRELNGIREIWLISVLPLVMFRLPDEKWLKVFWICLVTGAASTGVYNLFKYFQLNLSMNHFRAGGFFNTMHPLSYTGITGLLFFLSLASSLYFWQKNQKKISIYIMVASFFILLGFMFSNSKGGYIALACSLTLFLIFVLKKKFIFVLPVFLITLNFAYKNLPGLSYKFEQEKQSFIYQIKNDIKCGSTLERIYYIQTGLSIWQNNPILGVGVGAYPEEYQKYRPQGVCGVAALPDVHLHNDFLNTLALFGAVGFTIFLMFYILPFLQAFQFARFSHVTQTQGKNISPKTNWLITGSLTSISMMFFMGLTQCHFTDEEVQMVFWLALGLFYRNSQ